MTEERDVLSAEETEAAFVALSDRILMYGQAPLEAEAMDLLRSLAASHEALRACLEETRRERDDSRSRFELRLEVEALARAVAAEAEVDRLREALTEIAGVDPDEWLEGGGWSCVKFIEDKARDALSAPVSTPNSQKEEGANG